MVNLDFKGPPGLKGQEPLFYYVFSKSQIEKDNSLRETLPFFARSPKKSEKIVQLKRDVN